MPLPPNTEERSETIESYAIFSDCGDYRYFLSRTWDDTLPVMMFIMLNPSKATEVKYDKTVMLCTNRAVKDGFGELWVLNLFAYCATDSSQLSGVNPIDPCNDEIIRQKVNMMDIQDKIVYAWGGNNNIKGRDIVVRKIVKNVLRARKLPLYHLGKTNSGYPRHPLGPLNKIVRVEFDPWVEPEPEAQDAG